VKLSQPQETIFTMPVFPVSKEFKNTIFLAKTRAFESLEGFWHRIGLRCTHGLLLHAMQISLAKTT